MIKANELRINNILNYTTAENDILPTTLDWQDIKWISEDAKGFNLVHNPIELTEEWLLKFGFEICKLNVGAYEVKLNEFFNLFKSKDRVKGRSAFLLYSNDEYLYNSIEHVHQLQNLYFALTGKELELK